MNKEGNAILIITGGTIDENFLSDRVKPEEYTMIVAVDRGLLAADRLGLSLDYIVGDFDSVPEEILNKYKAMSTPIQTFPPEKDKTDTQIAMELALMHNPDKLDIVGGSGNRLDHVQANIQLLMLPLQLNVDACLLDSNNKIYLKKESFTIPREHQHGDYVSLLPFSEKVNGLTLKGFKYPLNKITLATGSSLGISNIIVSDEARVDFSDGILMVIEARD